MIVFKKQCRIFQKCFVTSEVNVLDGIITKVNVSLNYQFCVNHSNKYCLPSINISHWNFSCLPVLYYLSGSYPYCTNPVAALVILWCYCFHCARLLSSRIFAGFKRMYCTRTGYFVSYNNYRFQTHARLPINTILLYLLSLLFMYYSKISRLLFRGSLWQSAAHARCGIVAYETSPN